ncbi:aminoglycoside phosphotransferase family protein [Kribbella sp. NBC_00889]|uniref:aminoglycoside phosphotransferase family protein n=1 Tax=Kribbella sp. NBC_00889 TaxID=2975974 RepID=UPI003867622C|nr:aminoglycoside phosphotransferase family protein [Kribbella sp. NBC_00889]
MTTLSSGERDRLDTALRDIAGAAGIDPAGAVLLRYTMNAVYKLPAASLVLRIAPAANRSTVHRVTKIAHRLAELGLPTVRLAPGLEQPIETPDWTATAWTYLPQIPGQRHRQAELAHPLLAFHSLNDLGFPLPQWDPISRAQSRLETAAAARGDQLIYLQTWAASQVRLDLSDLVGWLRKRALSVRGAAASAEWRLPTSVIHGDAHAGNLLTDMHGQSVLCDLDSVSTGPPEWDLVPAAHGVERFGDPREQYDELSAAYGFDLLSSPTWPTLRSIRELQIVTSVIGGLTGRPDVADELAHRLRSLIAGDTDTWHRYR